MANATKNTTPESLRLAISGYTRQIKASTHFTFASLTAAWLCLNMAFNAQNDNGHMYAQKRLLTDMAMPDLCVVNPQSALEKGYTCPLRTTPITEEEQKKAIENIISTNREIRGIKKRIETNNAASELAGTGIKGSLISAFLCCSLLISASAKKNAANQMYKVLQST